MLLMREIGISEDRSFLIDEKTTIMYVDQRRTAWSIFSHMKRLVDFSNYENLPYLRGTYQVYLKAVAGAEDYRYDLSVSNDVLVQERLVCDTSVLISTEEEHLFVRKNGGNSFLKTSLSQCRSTGLRYSLMLHLNRRTQVMKDILIWSFLDFTKKDISFFGVTRDELVTISRKMREIDGGIREISYDGKCDWLWIEFDDGTTLSQPKMSSELVGCCWFFLTMIRQKGLLCIEYPEAVIPPSKLDVFEDEIKEYPFQVVVMTRSPVLAGLS